MFLFAGDNDEGGSIPSIPDMSWILHVDEEQLETDMIELQRLGILSVVDGNWIVTNFAKRQEPLPKKEYMRRVRKETSRDEYYKESDQPVTIGNTDKIRIDTDKDIDLDRDSVQPDKFTQVQWWIEELTGYMIPAQEKEINALKEMVNLGVIKDDIAGAVAFFRDQNKVASGAAHLLNSVKYQRSKRVQEKVINPNTDKLYNMTQHEKNLAAIEEFEKEHGIVYSKGNEVIDGIARDSK